MADAKQGNTNLIFGFLFTLIAIVALIALILTKSQADDVSSTASITNVAPTVDSVTIAIASAGVATDPISLTAGGNTTVYIHGDATDTNGCEDIDNADGTTDKWTAVFYRTDVAGGSSCTPDSTNCYDLTESDTDLTTCTAGGSDTGIHYEFSVPVKYYADATDVGSSPDHSATQWTASITAADAAGASGSNTATAEISTVKGLSVTTSSVSYDALAFGATSTEKTVTVVNQGNYNVFDPTVSMSADWSCTIGTITKTNTTASSTSGGAFSAITNSPSSMNLDIAKTTTGSPSSGSFYTKLTIPASGVGGTCTSTLVVGAGT